MHHAEFFVKLYPMLNQFASYIIFYIDFQTRLYESFFFLQQNHLALKKLQCLYHFIC